MQIQRFTFGPFETNTYVVTIHEPMVNEQMVLVIDPACSNTYEQQQLENCINSQTLKLSNKDAVPNVAIIATHGHLDHLWGARWATEKWHTPVLMHEADIPMVKAMQQQYNMFGIRATAEPFEVDNIKSKI